MGWIRRWLLGEEEPQVEHSDERSDADACDAAIAAADAEVEGLEGSPDAERGRPIDLSADLDAGMGGGLAGRVDLAVEELMALAVEADREVGRPMLAELARRLRRNELRLPPMPQAVVRVQRKLDSGRCNIKELADEIELDPALATRLVGIANSPFYQGMDLVQSVSDAVVRIGLGETRNIVLAVALRLRVFRVPGMEVEIERLWAHSLAASVAAETLGAAVGEDPDACFLLGLVHDIGRVVLFSLIGEIERTAKSRQPMDGALLDRIDRSLHPQLGAAVAHAWGIDSELVDAIASHHRVAEELHSGSSLARVAHAADLLAHRIQPPPDAAVPGGRCDTDEAAWSAVLDALGMDASDAQELERETAEALEARSKRL